MRDGFQVRRWTVFGVAVAAFCAMAAEGLVLPRRAEARVYKSPPTGVVFVPKKLFKPDDNELDELVIRANPRLYLGPGFKRDAQNKVLVVAMPGWGGRSENFIWTVINGLKRPEFAGRLMVAAIQDPVTGGPRYQGQGSRAHANVWRMSGDSIKTFRRFFTRLAVEFGHLDVWLVGYSSGAVTAPRLATRVARTADKKLYTMAGSVAIGTGSAVRASALKKHNQRTLFVVVPQFRKEDEKPMRDDQYNRKNALRSIARLQKNNGPAYLRTVESARRHVDWHWGLLSQCRYFRTKRIDPGRGYWPNYWKPNPETYGYIVPFLLGKEPPETMSGVTPQTCLY